VKVALIVATAGRTGVESVVAALAEEFRAQGIDARVIAFEDGPLIERLRGANVPVEVVPVRGKADLGGMRRLARVIRSHRPDIAHTHGQRAMFIGNLAAKGRAPAGRAPIGRAPMARVAIVTTFHELAGAKARETRLWRLYAQIESLLARLAADRCVAISQAVRRDAAGVRRVPNRRIEVIYNPLDLSRFNPAVEADRHRARALYGLTGTDVVIGMVGRLIPLKAHRLTLDALPVIAADFPTARLLLAGDGPLRAELTARAQSLNVADRVIFAGDVGAIETIYGAIDVLAHPSLSEGLGLAVIEALACGVPVVASDVGGLPEILRLSAANRSVPAGDPAALAAALIDVLRAGAGVSPAEIDVVRALFSAHVIAAQHIALYRSLLSER
jgi:glycosyltransferase involved in cell wall biosynthesis